MADAADSKSAGGDIVRVQVPPSASIIKKVQPVPESGGLSFFSFIPILNGVY